MAVVLDAGALVALEGVPDRSLVSVLKEARRNRTPVRVAAGVLAQVWRSGSRQAHLSRQLKGMLVVPLDDHGARRVGELLATTGTSDVVDAHCALVVRAGDTVLTSEPKDLRQLLFARGVRAGVHRI